MILSFNRSASVPKGALATVPSILPDLIAAMRAGSSPICKYRRFLYRVDADPLEHRAHAEIRRRTEPADAKFFALELFDAFDLRTCDQLVIQFVEQPDEVNDDPRLQD